MVRSDLHNGGHQTDQREQLTHLGRCYVLAGAAGAEWQTQMVACMSSTRRGHGRGAQRGVARDRLLSHSRTRMLLRLHDSHHQLLNRWKGS